MFVFQKIWRALFVTCFLLFARLPYYRRFAMFVVRKRLLTFSLHDQDYKETRTGKDVNSTALFTKTQH